MRILGWVLLIAGLLLCASILWAAVGFLLMGFGLICLQIAEARRRRVNLTAPRPGIFDPPLPYQERSRAPTASDTGAHEGVDRESTTAQYSYDKKKWRFLLDNDADISRLAKTLAPYGQKYVDELAAAYLVLNDKDYLPIILRKIMASARRDRAQGSASERLHENPTTDAAGEPFRGTRQSDEVRDLRADPAYNPISVTDMPEIDADLNKVRASEPSEQNLFSRVDANAARAPVIAQMNLKRATMVVQAASNLRARSQNPVQATNLNPAVTDASVASDVGQAGKAASEQTKLKPVPTVAHAARELSAGRQNPQATNLNPAVTDASVASDVGQADKAASEQTKLKPVPTVAHAARELSAGRQNPQATNLNPAATGASAAGVVSQAGKASEQTKLEPAPTVGHAASELSAARQNPVQATNLNLAAGASAAGD